MNAEFSLDQPRRERAPDLRQAMRQARLAHGVAYLDQLRDMLLLGLSPHGLEPADYYLYGLCDHRRHDRARPAQLSRQRRGACAPVASTDGQGLASSASSG